MLYNIIPLLGVKDEYKFKKPEGSVVLEMPIHESDDKRKCSSNFWNIIDFNHINIDNIETDLYRLAVCIYLTDLMISRGASYDGWTRSINLVMPVSDTNHWEKAKETIETLLSFLSGDIWTISFRECKVTRPVINKKEWKKGNKTKTTATTLFSGGLDSFIGAVDLISEQDSLSLVSHYGDGATSKTQEKVCKEMRKSFPKKNINLFQFGLLPRYQDQVSKESTQRARSFLFLVLGIIIAKSNGNNLVVPENGFISLNVPLTISRLGSCSTRTTHPYIMNLFQGLIKILGINKFLITPYKFMTKGEMLIESKNWDFVQKYSKITMSCAHPTHGRWIKGGNPNKHCGYCIPCIIRRSSMFRAGLDDKDDYEVDVLKSMPVSNGQKKDLKAFLIAINSSKKNKYMIQQSGPIETDIDNYNTVYKNGLREVSAFLKNKKY